MNTPSPPPVPTVGSQLQNSSTPFGSIGWTKGPNGQWTSTTTPGAGAQNAINAFNQENPASINDVIKQASGLGTQFMNPFFQQQDSNLAAQLQNEGFSVGDQAYQNALRGLETNQSNWVGGNIAQFAPIAFQNYMAPLQAASMALNPQNINPNAGAVQNAANTSTAASEYNYGQQVANKSAQNAGLFGIPAAALGGWAKGGFGLPGMGGGDALAGIEGVSSGGVGLSDLLASLALV